MKRHYRVAVGGWQHETNTFAPHKAHYEDFVKADAWPGMTVGADVFDDMRGLNIPLPGFVEAAESRNFELHPILWASAEPSSYVTEDAFERVANMICESISTAGSLDAVYLDLHGAMVAEHHQDGEGELLRRVRAIVGPDLPVVISLDLHANVTEAMVEHTSAITIFRTYPHLDMAETGARACDLLSDMLGGKAVVGRMRQIPFLIPLAAQYTGAEPCRSIYAGVAAAVNNGVCSADFACGFPASDIFESGAAVVVYGEDQRSVDAQLDALYALVVEAESQFANELLSPDEAVKQAMLLKADAPVVLADAQDNPGAGGTSDTVGLLHALVENAAQGAVMAVVHDPEVAAAAHEAGEGALLETSLGAKIDYPGVIPFSGTFRVDKITDGNFICTGDMYKDSHAELGPMALLTVVDRDCDVQVIVSTGRFQCLDLAVFRHVGVEPTQQRLLVVKSTVHFRADFEPIAAQTLVVAAPGAHPCQLANLPYKFLRKGVRLEPNGPVHA